MYGLCNNTELAMLINSTCKESGTLELYMVSSQQVGWANEETKGPFWLESQKKKINNKK